MKLIRVIGINILIILGLVGLILILPATIDQIYNSIYLQYKKTNDDSRQFLPNYIGHNWSEGYYNEFHQIDVNYFDYYVWRRDDFNGKNINIKNGVRNTIKNFQNNNKSQAVHFFGGSTIWGSGLSDEFTIPSKFAYISKTNTYNYGETAYIGMQSLIYLNELYISKKLSKPIENIIIFNDGANDVLHRCRTYVNSLETHRQYQIRNRLDGGDESTLNFKYLFKPILSLVQKFKSVSSKVYHANENDYNCHNNKNKADLIATSLLETWLQAKKIAEANGDTFIAVLQPVVYLENPKNDYLNDYMDIENSLISKQFHSVYSIILDKVKNYKDLTFIDLTDIYNLDDYIYIDCCHVGPKGSKIYAQKIYEHLRQNKFLN